MWCWEGASTWCRSPIWCNPEDSTWWHQAGERPCVHTHQQHFGKEYSDSELRQDTSNAKHLKNWCMLVEKDAVKRHPIIERKIVEGSTSPKYTKVGRIWAVDPSVNCLCEMYAMMKKMREDVKHIWMRSKSWRPGLEPLAKHIFFRWGCQVGNEA